ncbi:EAL domain-containing protein [Vibrio panuliri]|uniref:Diguanylate phosphodiesterase n=1 Tax=Vibrio panuliri TaxID=1381081 RepID=A0ABX3FJ98_9VIBR|nr:EAL domain-containing protein [Vibrio panuliri]KAB1457363.1 EAL domain-containing protein [Vibrio panuliri]OLQ91477.1 diguanylate phosphodiesterase [Vibrio panuliri]
MLLSTKNQFQQLITTNEDFVFTGSYKDLTLKSVYQPIFDADDQAVGIEALVRINHASDGIIRPDQFFNSPDFSLEDKINVERLSRVIHIRNFAHSQYSQLNLFLNVLPSAGEFFALEDIRTSLLCKRLFSLGLVPKQLIMEVVEHDTRDEECLKHAMAKLSKCGFQIAIDDFGIQASNHERVERIKPDIIKIDRSLMLSYMQDDKLPLLKGLELAKRINAKVVVEGIETAQQLQAMKQLEIDYYQGYFLAMPQPIHLVNIESNNAI